MINEEINNINAQDYLERVEIIEITPNDCILLKLSATYRAKEVADIAKKFKEKFPDNLVICYPDNIDFKTISKEDLLKHINKIKNELKSSLKDVNK